MQTELDSLETASETSQSSAYFSLTPSLGSVTELSDTSSIDSFNEYDTKGKTGVSQWNIYAQYFLQSLYSYFNFYAQVRTAHLRATFERPNRGMMIKSSYISFAW